VEARSAVLFLLVTMLVEFEEEDVFELRVYKWESSLMDLEIHAHVGT
jgi:hypothetical protein